MLGLSLFFFNHKEWDRLYSHNCSLKTMQEWNAQAEPNIPIGALYATLGILCEIIYIPFMIVMFRPDFFQYSCYKFMFLLGVIDMMVLPCNSIYSGIQCMLGYHYCSNPSLHFITGAIPTCGWYGASMTCILLAFNRLFEMLAPGIAKCLFKGKRVYIWLAIPILYMLFTCFQAAFVYNIRLFAYHSNPFAGEDGWEITKRIDITFHYIHNVCVVFFLGGIYGILCIFIIMKRHSFSSSKLQILMTLQSMCICIEMFVAAIVYIYNQFLPLPDFLVIIAHASWICIHGDTPIVYLILNQPLRKAVFKLIRDLVGKPAGNPTNLIGNASMFTVAITRSMYQEITTNQDSVNLNPINSQDATPKQDAVNLNPINSQDATPNQDSVNLNPINSQDATANQGSVDRNLINSQDLRLGDEQHHN